MKKGLNKISIFIKNYVITFLNCLFYLFKSDYNLIILTDHLGDNVARFKIIEKIIEFYGKDKTFLLVNPDSYFIVKLLTENRNIIMFGKKDISDILKISKCTTIIDLTPLTYDNTNITKPLIHSKVYKNNDEGKCNYVLYSQMELLNKLTNNNNSLEELYPDLTKYFIKNIGDYYVVGMGASFAKGRIYSVEKLAKIIESISHKKIFLLGKGKEEEEYYKKMSELLKSKENIFNLVNRTSIEDSIKLINNSKLFIGTEAGLWNISYSLKVPSIVFYGGGHFGRFMHKSNFIKYFYEKMDCFNCLWNCSKLKNEIYECIQNIDENEVIKFLREFENEHN